MKTNFTLITVCVFLWLSGVFAKSQWPNNLNGFVNYKNTDSLGAYQLRIGIEEKASLTYNYSGTAGASGMRAYCDYMDQAHGIINSQIKSSEVKVYPNPASEYTIIESLGSRIDKVELVNLLGQKVFVAEVNDLVIKINTTHLLNGTYFIRIYFNNNTVTKKINISK